MNLKYLIKNEILDSNFILNPVSAKQASLLVLFPFYLVRGPVRLSLTNFHPILILNCSFLLVMGTRGYRVIRFRNRYYRFYNHYDSYPEGLGKDIATQIPQDPAAYQKWLTQQRQEALEWHNALEQFLCRNNAEELDADQENPWGVDTEDLPDFKPRLNDLYIEWVYTIDLDNEVFTIDNGAHVKLSRASDLAWIPALARGFYGDKILLPGSIHKEAIANIIINLPAPPASVLNTYMNLDVKMVQAKGLHGFSPSSRHGPLFRSRIFYFFREIYEPILAAVLLSWRSEDLVFRDIAYAVLSLASANLYPSIISDLYVLQNRRIAFAALQKGGEGSEKDEFISDLGVGSHPKDVLPGSSPDSEMYWFGSVLVQLVGQLIDLPETLNAAIVSVVQYCQTERPNQCVDVILMSIEHVVLMTVGSDGRVQRTEPLCLFDIQMHTSMNASERYDESELEELQKNKQTAIKNRETRRLRYLKKLAVDDGRPIEDEPKDIESDQSDDEGSRYVEEQTSWPAAGLNPPRVKEAEAGFFALAFFLEASTRRHLPPSRTQGGVFPSEIYRMILLHIEDVETHRACMQVSRNFWDMCQDDILMMDKFRLQANKASETYEPGAPSFPALRMQNMSTHRSSDVILKRTRDLSRVFGRVRGPETWRLVVGSDYNRRSLVSDLTVLFDEVK